MYSEACQEHLDHEMGRGGDLQNAYALSCIEQAAKGSDSPGISGLRAAGRFVVVSYWHGYCRYTDAALPTQTFYNSDWATLAEATAALAKLEQEAPSCDEAYHAILAPPSAAQKAYQSLTDADVPF